MLFPRSFLRDILLYIPIKLLPAVSIFTIILYFAKHLSGSDYLSYSTGLSVSAISVQLCCGWLSAAIVFLLPISSNRELFISDSIILCVTLGFASGLIGGFITLVILQDPASAVIVFAICLTQSFYVTFNAISQADRRVIPQLIASGIFSAALLVFAILSSYLLQANQRIALASFALAYMVGLLPITIPHLLRTFQNIRTGTRRSYRENVVAIARYGSPLSVWAASLLILNSGEKFFPIQSGTFETYIVTKDLLIGGSSLISMPLIMAAHPLIFRAFREGRSYIKLITSCITLLSIAFGFVWCLFYFFGFDILRSLTSKNPHEVKLEVFIIYFALYLSSLGIYIQKPLEIEFRTTTIAAISVVVAIVSLPAFFAFTPKYDALGAAITLLLSQITYIFFLTIISKLPALQIIKAIIIFLAVIAIGYSLKGFAEQYLSHMNRVLQTCLWLVLYFAFVAATTLTAFKKICEI